MEKLVCAIIIHALLWEVLDSRAVEDTTYEENNGFQGVWGDSFDEAPTETEEEKEYMNLHGLCDLIPANDWSTVRGSIHFEQKAESTLEMYANITGLSATVPFYTLQVYTSGEIMDGCRNAGELYLTERYNGHLINIAATNENGELMITMQDIAATLVGDNSIFGRSVHVTSVFAKEPEACCVVVHGSMHSPESQFDLPGSSDRVEFSANDKENEFESLSNDKMVEDAWWSNFIGSVYNDAEINNIEPKSITSIVDLSHSLDNKIIPDNNGQRKPISSLMDNENDNGLKEVTHSLQNKATESKATQIKYLEEKFPQEEDRNIEPNSITKIEELSGSLADIKDKNIGNIFSHKAANNGIDISEIKISDAESKKGNDFDNMPSVNEIEHNVKNSVAEKIYTTNSQGSMFENALIINEKKNSVVRKDDENSLAKDFDLSATTVENEKIKSAIESKLHLVTDVMSSKPINEIKQNSKPEFNLPLNDKENGNVLELLKHSESVEVIDKNSKSPSQWRTLVDEVGKEVKDQNITSESTIKIVDISGENRRNPNLEASSVVSGDRTVKYSNDISESYTQRRKEPVLNSLLLSKEIDAPYMSSANENSRGLIRNEKTVMLPNLIDEVVQQASKTNTGAGSMPRTIDLSKWNTSSLNLGSIFFRSLDKTRENPSQNGHTMINKINIDYMKSASLNDNAYNNNQKTKESRNLVEGVVKQSNNNNTVSDSQLKTIDLKSWNTSKTNIGPNIFHDTTQGNQHSVLNSFLMSTDIHANNAKSANKNDNIEHSYNQENVHVPYLVDKVVSQAINKNILMNSLLNTIDLDKRKTSSANIGSNVFLGTEQKIENLVPNSNFMSTDLPVDYSQITNSKANDERISNEQNVNSHNMIYDFKHANNKDTIASSDLNTWNSSGPSTGSNEFYKKEPNAQITDGVNKEKDKTWPVLANRITKEVHNNDTTAKSIFKVTDLDASKNKLENILSNVTEPGNDLTIKDNERKDKHLPNLIDTIVKEANNKDITAKSIVKIVDFDRWNKSRENIAPSIIVNEKSDKTLDDKEEREIHSNLLTKHISIDEDTFNTDIIPETIGKTINIKEDGYDKTALNEPQDSNVIEDMDEK